MITMDGVADDCPPDVAARRERPFLLPWNRKLRNLQGISIRNLNVTAPIPCSHGKTITDDEIPYNLRSPAKMLGASDALGLQQSRSFTDLKDSGNERLENPKQASTAFDKNGRPGMRIVRRRSTLHWAGASPAMRQKKLEDVAMNRMADVWFSIHCRHITEPIYVSEVMEKCMNPSFRSFDLNNFGPRVTREDTVTLKLWAKTDRMVEYAMLLDLVLSLGSLQYVGKNLENFHHPLPENCVLFHLADGIYTSFTDMPVEDFTSSLHNSRPAKSGQTENSSSYDALMRLANLVECIQDALATREDLEMQINSILHKDKALLTSVNAQLQEQERLASTDRASLTEKRQLRLLDKKIGELHQSLRLRSSAITAGGEGQKCGYDGLERIRKKIEDIGIAVERSTRESRRQVCRICGDLALIYPIEPIKNKQLHFTIRGICLPNSVFDDTNRDEIAAALGFTSQLVHMLSLYLFTPLPYPMQANGLSSCIADPISVALPQRTFPLYPTNVSYKFEYGVFLLNKNIEFLMDKNGLRMLDIRHTLPNLKYLMYVLTAGVGELPSRGAGGVKGLIVGGATRTISRQGSDESVSAKVGSEARSAVDGQGRNSSKLKPSGKEEKIQADISGSVKTLSTDKPLPHRNSVFGRGPEHK